MALAKASIPSIQRAPPAPDTLSPGAKAHWKVITESLRPEYFLESDLPVLALYCESLAAADTAREHIVAEGAILPSGKKNPWMQVLGQETKLCGTLSMRLRLIPQSRMDRMVAGGKVRPVRRAPWDVDAQDADKLKKYGL